MFEGQVVGEDVFVICIFSQDVIMMEKFAQLMKVILQMLSGKLDDFHTVW